MRCEVTFGDTASVLIHASLICTSKTSPHVGKTRFSDFVFVTCRGKVGRHEVDAYFWKSSGFVSFYDIQDASLSFTDSAQSRKTQSDDTDSPRSISQRRGVLQGFEFDVGPYSSPSCGSQYRAPTHDLIGADLGPVDKWNL